MKLVLNEIVQGTPPSTWTKSTNNTGDLARRSFQPSPGSPVRLLGFVVYVRHLLASHL